MTVKLLATWSPQAGEFLKLLFCGCRKHLTSIRRIHAALTCDSFRAHAGNPERGRARAPTWRMPICVVYFLSFPSTPCTHRVWTAVLGLRVFVRPSCFLHGDGILEGNVRRKRVKSSHLTCVDSLRLGPG